MLENRHRVITIKGVKREEKAETYKTQHCNSWGTNTCKAIVTLIPAADDPGSPYNETHERLFQSQGNRKHTNMQRAIIDRGTLDRHPMTNGPNQAR